MVEDTPVDEPPPFFRTVDDFDVMEEETDDDPAEDVTLCVGRRIDVSCSDEGSTFG